MIWNSLTDFVQMHGYGPYVWGSFGVTFLLMSFEVLNLRKKRKQLTQVDPT
jgi:heme exporter protein D